MGEKMYGGPIVSRPDVLWQYVEYPNLGEPANLQAEGKLNLLLLSLLFLNRR